MKVGGSEVLLERTPERIGLCVFFVLRPFIPSRIGPTAYYSSARWGIVGPSVCVEEVGIDLIFLSLLV